MNLSLQNTEKGVVSGYKKKWIVGKQTERVMPLIEEKYDEIYEICEKGNKLLY